jgi:hypothetical protein
MATVLRAKNHTSGQLKDDLKKNITKHLPEWFWFDKDNYRVGDVRGWTKVPTEENMDIEKEYQSELKNARSGQRVYHCFGNGWTAILSFSKMKTYCGSGRCMLGHHGKDVKEDHMEYDLKRVIN